MTSIIWQCVFLGCGDGLCTFYFVTFTLWHNNVWSHVKPTVHCTVGWIWLCCVPRNVSAHIFINNWVQTTVNATAVVIKERSWLEVMFSLWWGLHGLWPNTIYWLWHCIYCIDYGQIFKLWSLFKIWTMVHYLLYGSWRGIYCMDYCIVFFI